MAQDYIRSIDERSAPVAELAAATDYQNHFCCRLLPKSPILKLITLDHAKKMDCSRRYGCYLFLNASGLGDLRHLDDRRWPHSS